MAANLKELAEEFQRRGHPEMAYHLRNGARLAREIGIPEHFPGNEATSQFDIPTVSEELYLKTREYLDIEGYNLVVRIKPVSIGQLVTNKATSQRFESVHPSKNMRAIIPPQMEVAINPNNLRIINSNDKTTNDQIRMLEKEEAALKAKLPQEVRDLISIRLQNASVLAQVADGYQRKTGKVLFAGWFGRTDDQTVPGDGIAVGRYTPTSELDVSVWGRGVGFNNVFAVLMVVLPRRTK